ncbi:IPT/TIG domain-containing protein [Lutimonas halocynthiae]|uniref:IPT/TIG domain-containing protein n=1 Tax=Lutimonas halocynthiae TaxID=1446477 RepID=UPI0025B5AA09|nr:IPT/TIG domain-containing protein [Lutimonas halocynthiae]MDN3641855.1 IPT/TIG domain-containing protein [Lutimonas halocynthiae]
MLISVKCIDDEIIQTEYPRVQTLEANRITESGAVLNAEIIYQGNQEIIEYGFVWDQEENPTIESSEKRIIADKITTGGFSAQVETTLKENKIYYVRAYAKNNEYLVYGINTAFFSLGSEAANIEDFYPKTGNWGDTIILKGRHFSYLSNNNHVLFKDISSKVISSSDTTITCIVPDGINDENVSIYLNVANQQAVAKNKFELTVPEIQSFYPMKATFGDTIEFIGKNFSAVNEKNIISFNEHQAEVISSSKTKLSVIVPTSVNTHQSKVRLTLNLKSSSAEELFEVLAPKIFKVSPESGSSNTLIKITGDNFNPDKIGDTISFEKNYGEVVEASKKEMTVRIPFGTYTNRFIKVGVTVAGQTTYDSSLFTLEEPWIKRENVQSDVVNRYRATSFSLLNNAYVGLGSHSRNNLSNLSNDFYKYDPIQNSWLKISDFPGTGLSLATSFTIGNYAYVGTGRSSSGNTNEFWRYDPASDSWKQIESFPYAVSAAKGFSIDGRGYVFIENYSDNLWSYDPSIDKWTKMPGLDFDIGGGDYTINKGFVVEGKIYIAMSRNQSYTHLFEFDTETQQWTKKSGLDYSGAYGNYMGAGFSIDNVGYIMGEKSVYEYNYLSDSWKELSDFPIVDYYYYYPTSFVLDGKAYYGTGSYEPSAYEPSFWEYDPNYE